MGNFVQSPPFWYIWSNKALKKASFLVLKRSFPNQVAAMRIILNSAGIDSQMYAGYFFWIRAATTAA